MIVNFELDQAQILISEAEEPGCDLLATGAYGHTRFREVLLDGMTNKILQKMPVLAFVTH